MLHITNGDAAAEKIRRAGVPGEVFVWREILHEGPVPAALPLDALFEVRADYIASRGWVTADEARAHFAVMRRALDEAASHEEVVLWFEHDLFDQLQLLQLLDWFAEAPGSTLSLINPPEYLGPAASARLAELVAARRPVSPEQLEQGTRGWAAFRAPTPERMQAVVERGAPGLPFVAGAFRRLLEDLPGAGDGISRTERQVLEALGREPLTAGELFRAHAALEDPVWLGDSAFEGYLDALAAGPHPLITLEPAEGWHGRAASLTDDGRRVLEGQADAVPLRGIDRWLGGTRLLGRGPVWRWDRVAGRIAWR